MTAMIRAAGAALLATALFAGAASAAPASQRQCFYSRQISSWKDVGPDTAYLRVGASDVWRLDLAGPCPEMKWAQRLYLDHHGSTALICNADDLVLVLNEPRGLPTRCPVRAMHHLTREEVDALPAASRP